MMMMMMMTPVVLRKTATILTANSSVESVYGNAIIFGRPELLFKTTYRVSQGSVYYKR